MTNDECEAAARQLIPCMRRRAVYWYHRHGEIFDASDYESAGYEGLALACRDYDANKGASLRTHAMHKCDSVMQDVKRYDFGSRRSKFWCQTVLRPEVHQKNTERSSSREDAMFMLYAVLKRLPKRYQRFLQAQFPWRSEQTRPRYAENTQLVYWSQIRRLVREMRSVHRGGTHTTCC